MRKFTKVIIILALALFLSESALAETLTWQEPMRFELNLEEPGTYESASIQTSGIITSITANWDFQGEVTLEISADGARHYLPLVNGVPLSIPDTARGNQLRYKVHVGENSNISDLTLAYTDTLGVASTFGNPELSGFRYQLPIYIAYSGEDQSDLFNYPVKISLREIKGQSPFLGRSPLKGPVRFTAADGKTLLSYYRENQVGESALVEFWVKVPQIPKDGTTIYLYYGNPGACDLSSGEEVFDFFDDFKGEVLDEEKWQFLPDLKGAGSLKKGRLNLLDSEIKSSKFSVKDNSLLEFKAHTTDAYTDIQAILDELVFYSSSFSGAQHAIARDGQVEINLDLPIEAGGDYIYQISRCGNNFVFSRRGRNGEVAKVAFPAVSDDEMLQLSLKSRSTSSYRGGAYFDWVRVRPFFETKPCVVSVGRAQPANLAHYTDKYYVSEIVPTDFPVRIIVIRLGDKSGTAPLYFSADGGRTYTPITGRESPHSRGGVPATPVYYYASKGDFQTGEGLRWKMELEDRNKVGGQSPFGDSPPKVTLTYYPGTITLLSPNGGEELLVGSKEEILWSAEEYERTYPLRLEYSLNEGRTNYLIAENIANSARYIWQVPEGAKGKVLLRVSDFYDPEVYDVSDEFVEIK